MIIIHCLYEEFKPETYKGMQARWPDERHVTFYSESPNKDLVDCINYLYGLGFTKSGQVLTSSSVDHFFVDQRSADDVYASTRS